MSRIALTFNISYDNILLEVIKNEQKFPGFFETR